MVTLGISDYFQDLAVNADVENFLSQSSSVPPVTGTSNVTSTTSPGVRSSGTTSTGVRQTGTTGVRQTGTTGVRLNGTAGVVRDANMNINDMDFEEVSTDEQIMNSMMVNVNHHFAPIHHQDMDHSGSGPDSLHGDTPSPKGRKQKEDKYCGVCGDRALGYNFDAISCESCKAFFRRNAPKSLDYFKCPYEEKCKMDVSNRRFCKRCRLRKCFEIGMRKEYILTDEEKKRKRERIEENRKKDPVPCVYGTSALLEKVRMQISDVTTTQHSHVRPLTEDDSMMIGEVITAYKMSLEVGTESDYPRSKPQLSDLVNIAELSVRRVIDMSKKIKSFKALCQLDQISLLKGGSIELLIIRSVITFDREKQHFLDPYDSEANAMTTEELQMGEGSGLFDEHMKFVKSLAVELHADETTLILLLVISLFSPDRPNLQDKEYIASEQDKYALLLLRYLESIYPNSHVRNIYPKMLMKLTDIRNLNEEHSQVLLKVNPEGIQPLMKEVLDLNPPKLKE